MNSEVSVLGYDVYGGSISNLKVLCGGQICVNTLNAYSYVIAKKDEHFKEALHYSDYLLPDGFPITFASWALGEGRIRKIAGEDVFFYLLNIVNQNKGRVFFLGASELTLSKIGDRLSVEFPGLSFALYSPAFTEQFTDQESQDMIDAINRFSPDVLFVGMTAPKQEKWVHQFKALISANVICSIGAVFDFYAQTIKRPSSFWINLHLEWFVRLIREPRRLWKRYLWYSPQFMFDVIKEKFRA